MLEKKRLDIPLACSVAHVANNTESIQEDLFNWVIKVSESSVQTAADFLHTHTHTHTHICINYI